MELLQASMCLQAVEVWCMVESLILFKHHVVVNILPVNRDQEAAVLFKRP